MVNGKLQRFLEHEKGISRVINKNLISPLTEIQIGTVVKHLNSIRDLSYSKQGLLQQRYFSEVIHILLLL